MMMDFTVVGFILAVFCAGVAVGKLVEKVERFIRRKEDEEDKIKNKNDRRQSLRKITEVVFDFKLIFEGLAVYYGSTSYEV